MLEKEIENAVCVYARSRGMSANKYKTPNRRNAPDRVFFLWPRLCFFIEFKAPGKKPTKGQLREHQRLRNLKHYVYVCDNPEEGKRIIDLWHAYALTLSPVPGPSPAVCT